MTNTPPQPTTPVIQITEVRAEYTSARRINANLEHRIAHQRWERPLVYMPAEIDFKTAAGNRYTIAIRDYDVRFLDRVSKEEAVAHVDRIHRARRSDSEAHHALEAMARSLHSELSPRFLKTELIENECVVPYTTDQNYPETLISNKGSVLLHLSRKGFATPDFCFLTSNVYHLDTANRNTALHSAMRNLVKLSGRRLGDPNNPLLIAMRSAMPDYLPGFMPTYLNVGYVPALLSGLPDRYGEAAVSRIRLSNRRTILEALDPDAIEDLTPILRHDLTDIQNNDLAIEIEARIARYDQQLLTDPYHQLEFLLSCVYDYYDQHFDALSNFMGNTVRYPTVIMQRMVCSVINQESYAGVLYSRHPRIGSGIHLQYARTIYGEELMTGRLVPDEVHFASPKEARKEFPAVYHFWKRLPHLEKLFLGPVMVEFTAVQGTFTILQVNQAQLTGAGMLTAVMDLYESGIIDDQRVQELIEPFHIRQLESDTIDPESFEDLNPFAQGLSVLPRTAVTGRLFFSMEKAEVAKVKGKGGNVILVQHRFTPADTVSMQNVQGICSLSPAAIHVVTTAQTLGIPSLLDLKKDGVRIGDDGATLIGRNGIVIKEGQWVTISSRKKTLFRGRAAFATARLFRFMDGEDLGLQPDEQDEFTRLAMYYRRYQALIDRSNKTGFKSLQEFGQSIRGGQLQNHPEDARELVNRCVDQYCDLVIERLFGTTLGTHLNNRTAYLVLTIERQVTLLTAMVKSAREQGRHGYQAGSFVIGCLVEPDAPIDLWRQLSPQVLGFLLNEWVVHQQYRDLITKIGERKLNRAREMILTKGLTPIRLHVGRAKEFISLKLSGVDLDAVIDALPSHADAQTEEILDLLKEPYGAFYDYERRSSLAPLKTLCEQIGRPVPKAGER